MIVQDEAYQVIDHQVSILVLVSHHHHDMVRVHLDWDSFL